MTVEEARQVYARAAYDLLTDYCSQWWERCPACFADACAVEAASVALDLAVAQAHPSPPNLAGYIGRPHAGIAW